MNGYTFRESNSFIVIFTSLLNMGPLLKEKNCSKRSKFFPFRVDTIFEGLHGPGRKQEVTKLIPLNTYSII